MARTSTKTKVETKSSPKASKIVKSIPNSETGTGVVYYTKPNESGDKYIISQNPLKMQFTLWKCIEDGFEKIATSDNPTELSNKISFER